MAAVPELKARRRTYIFSISCSKPVTLGQRCHQFVSNAPVFLFIPLYVELEDIF
jgi:hypothetical protein